MFQRGNLFFNNAWCYRKVMSTLTNLQIKAASWFNPARPDPGKREKINLNFYFHTLWCFKRFYDGLKGLYKTF